MNFSEVSLSALTEIPSSKRPLRAIGIDLGTTNSTVAEIELSSDGTTAPKPTCVDVEQPTRQGPLFHTLVPSVLAVYDGATYVGAGAKDLRVRLSDLNLQQNRDIFWDCKNEIGVRKTYHQAGSGFRSAKEIAGHILQFLMGSATGQNQLPVETTVITVPASFQAAQRKETMDAAGLAGIDLSPGALLDEPIAAFLQYLCSEGPQFLEGSRRRQKLAVFDFGGGTCDVALFELRPLPSSDPSGLGVAPLAVSRYHRLGGGDIDRAIVVKVLLPQLLKQNNLKLHDMDFREKSNFVIPALLGCAESLKIGLCREIDRLKRLGRWSADKDKLVQTSPSVYPCNLPDRSPLDLKTPSLSLAAFESVLEPFLDRHLLHARESDYHMTCSIFAPIQDALERSTIERNEVGACLLVGGSSLIPQVADAVKDFFSRASVLSFNHPEAVQTAVAQGAAWQSLALALNGQGIIRPITSETISIKSARGLVELIPSGTEVPFPSATEWGEYDRLVVPETKVRRNLHLSVEVCRGRRGRRGRPLINGIWTIPPPVRKGDPLRLKFRLDANQVLELRLLLRNQVDSAEEFRLKVENPLTSVVNPNATRNEILALEEQLRTKEVSLEWQKQTVREIARLEGELGQYEKALFLLAQLNRLSPDVEILNQMGILSGKMGDHIQEEKFFREGMRVASYPKWNGPLFNLTLSQQSRGLWNDALKTIDEAIGHGPDPPELVLKARIVERLGHPTQERDALLHEALAGFGPPASLSDFELSWFRFGADMANDSARKQAATEETSRRAEISDSSSGSILPDKVRD